MSEEFHPEYPGDTPNRKYVRDLMAAKGIHVTYFDVILHMSARHIRWHFERIMEAKAES